MQRDYLLGIETAVRSNLLSAGHCEIEAMRCGGESNMFLHKRLDQSSLLRGYRYCFTVHETPNACEGTNLL